MADVRFDGRVVIVTGAGLGLGRAYALGFARRGAKVVVNDLGQSSVKGEGQASQRPAQAVVDEICSFGGEAVANFDSVVDGDKIVQTAIDAFGRIDIVVNNAGILRDISFGRMADKDWNLVYDVHLRGPFSVTQAAWRHMREQKYGRIVFVSSVAGMYGNFGQANYSSMKTAVHGLCQTLAKEGKKRNILVNTLIPTSGSRMTESIMPKALVDAMRPEYVAPLVWYLSSEANKSTGRMFDAAGGFFAETRWERSQGYSHSNVKNMTIEDIAQNFRRVTDFSDGEFPGATGNSASKMLKNLNYKPKSKI